MNGIADQRRDGVDQLRANRGVGVAGRNSQHPGPPHLRDAAVAEVLAEYIQVGAQDRQRPRATWTRTLQSGRERAFALPPFAECAAADACLQSSPAKAFTGLHLR